MKIFKALLFLALSGALVTFWACEDEELSPYLDPETAVHGFGRLTPCSFSKFVVGYPNTPIHVDFNWNSIDGKNTVTRIEFYVFFDEPYTDTDNNDRVAQHGGDYFDYSTPRGKLWKVLEAGAQKNNREVQTLLVTQAEVYQLYKDAKYNYGKGEVPVFANPDNPTRTAAQPFLPGDNFFLGWILHTEDGRKFDAWSPSICAEEFANSSCFVDWGAAAYEFPGNLDFFSHKFVFKKPDGKDSTVNDKVIYPAAGSVDTLKGTLMWTATAVPGGNPFQDIFKGDYSIPDASFGMYTAILGANPADQIKLTYNCGKLSLSGTDANGKKFTYKVAAVSGAKLTIDWSTDEGRKGSVILTRKDGKIWPPVSF